MAWRWVRLAFIGFLRIAILQTGEWVFIWMFRILRRIETSLVWFGLPFSFSGFVE